MPRRAALVSSIIRPSPLPSDGPASPPLDSPDYKSTALRHPKQPLIYLPHSAVDLTGPQLGQLRTGVMEHDLTKGHPGEPVGERFIEWNFVASSKDRIEQAKADWRAGRMKLPDADDQEFIPLPEPKK